MAATSPHIPLVASARTNSSLYLTNAVDAKASNTLGGSSRLAALLAQMDKLLSDRRYVFDVFARNTVNFGLLLTYRQTWIPQQYQVGDLVKTIPLAPREVMRYTTRSVTKKTRATKELEDNVQTLKDEVNSTSRADQEIVNKATQRTNFDVQAHENWGGQGVDIGATESSGGSTGKDSTEIKKNFHENVLRSAREYRQQHRTEVEVTESTEREETSFHEVQNPNDELAVTYLFYELQRTYKISEKLHQLTPVILVANDVPAPNEIDDAWLVQHDWILNRTLLDDSFKPALDYLKKGFVGAEINIRILEANAQAQKQLVDNLNQQIQVQTGILSADQQAVLSAVKDLGQSKEEQGLFNTVKRIFDPIGITGNTDTGVVNAAQAMEEYAKDTLDRAERDKAQLVSQLQTAVGALQQAVDKLSAAVKDHYDCVVGIDRLRVHVKENILYYMHAIWNEEPPDQRFFRLYNIDVPIITPDPNQGSVHLNPGAATREERLVDMLLGRAQTYTTKLPPLKNYSITMKKLYEIADLDNVLAYKGNYMIFALKEFNYLTLEMMQGYLDVGDEVFIRDPDEFGNYSVDDLKALATCVNQNSPDTFKDENNKKELTSVLARLIAAAKTNDDLVIVPTTSLYIECLVGTHPLLEDFKLIHRALDVKKVQAEVRHAELENVRLAARAMKNQLGDPDIEKVVVVGDNKNVTVDAGQ
jgi:hypothetical protein